MIVGASLTVMTPLGMDDREKPRELGTNRWSFKLEIGSSRTYGKWMVEGMAGAWLFTYNTSSWRRMYARSRPPLSSFRGTSPTASHR